MTSAGVDSMKEGLRAKFTQNQVLKKELLSTGKKTLVECTRDTTWGCGFHLHSKDADTPDNWTGGNLLGDLLMELRRDLH